MPTPQYSIPYLKLETPQLYPKQTPQLTLFLFPTPLLTLPEIKLLPGALGKQLIQEILNLSYSNKNNNTILPEKKPSQLGNSVAAAGVNAVSSQLSSMVSDKIFGDSELGRGMGNIFSSGLSSATNTIGNNILKGNALTNGLTQNVGASIAGAAAGLAANYIGKGVTSAMGDSRLGRATGAGIATGLGTVGGSALANLAKTGTWTTNLSKLNISPVGLGMSIAGSALGAATGPSKEYSGKYGNITQGMDLAYDGLTIAANFIPGAGLIISGAMALNKGLSNVFGSTDGMTTQDAVLGSAFMPAPVKWLNMWGSSKTGTFNNLSWLNTEKINNFMQNAFGNLQDKFDKARNEAGKTYGTFSQGAKRRALENLDFANTAWKKINDMADLNEILNIRSQYMSSINNLRYAQLIQEGWSPITRGKLGIKILNNATNHTVGMRLLSGAALIDNKQILLSRCRDLD